MIKTLTKIELRKMALNKRVSFSRDLSKEILYKILNSDDFKKAKNIALYYPIKNEIDLTGLFSVENKNFFLPKCVDNELQFVKFDGFENLKVGSFNILEPIGQSVNPEILDIIYTPALIANKKCFRLGYGKGFYDRFFKKHNLKAKKVIVISEKLVLDEFIEDSYDVQCDYIISA